MALQTSTVVVDSASTKKVVAVIGYTPSLLKILMHSAKGAEAYRRNPNAVCACSDDGNVLAALTVEGLGDGRDERHLVDCDCFGRPGWCEGRAGSGGGEGAVLDWTLS